MDGLRRNGTVAALIPPFVLLAVDPAGWYPFGPAKWLAGSVLVLLASASVASRGRVRLDVVTGRTWLVLLGVLSVAAAVGLDPRYAWTGTPERSLGVLTWVLFAGVFVVGQQVAGPTGPDRDGAAARAGAEAFVRAGTVAAALGVGAVATVEALGFGPDWLDVGAGRLTGTFGNAAFLGAATALLTPIAVSVALDSKRSTPHRWVAAVAAVLSTVGLVGSGTRSAWLGSVVALLVAAWTVRRRIPGRKAVAIGALVVVAAVGIAVFTPAGERLATVTDRDRPGGVGRVDEWRVASRVIADHPVTGVGPEGYRLAFGAATDRTYERAHGRDPLPDRAHSAPLDVALAGGIGAAAAWLVLVTTVGVRCVRVLSSGSGWRRGVAAGLLAHGIGLFVLFPTFELDVVAWLLAGLVVAWSPARTIRWSATTAVSWPVPRPVAPVAVALAVAAAAVGILGVAADRRAQVAARAIARGDGSAAVDAAHDATTLRPDVIRYRLLAARSRTAAGEGQVAALAEIDAARRWSPLDPIVGRERVRALVHRASATLVPSHVTEARRAVDDLLSRDPYLADGHLLDGDLALVEGRADAAVDAWDVAADLSPGSPEPWRRLVALHTERGDERRAADARAELDRLLGDGP